MMLFHSRRPSPVRRARLGLEQLEDRAVPAVTAMLDPGSDTGVPGDNKTKLDRPTISGTADVNAGAAEIELLDNMQQVLGQAAVDPQTGTWSIALANALPEGTNDLTARALDANMQEIPGESTAFMVTVDTGPPFPGPTLTLANKTGTSVTLAGTGESGSSIALLNAAGFVIQSTTVDFNGNWTIRLTLPVGAHQLRVAETDDAGNSKESDPLTVTVSRPRIVLTATLFTKKVGQKKLLFVRVTSSAGGAEREFRALLQKPVFRGVSVSVADSDSDGNDDTLVFSGKKGTRSIKRTMTV